MASKFHRRVSKEKKVRRSIHWAAKFHNRVVIVHDYRPVDNLNRLVGTDNDIMGLAIAKMDSNYAHLYILYNGDPPIEISWYERKYIRLASTADAVMFRLIGQFVPPKQNYSPAYPEALTRAIKFYKERNH